ncbi:LolA family protein [Marinicellulosiphila megalodicopiae]|uniref:LolA family protein n=1 Tax=Marinicellulosiphila megalodicopiae TaxID=2724896 RepID=UPI003BB15439
MKNNLKKLTLALTVCLPICAFSGVQGDVNIQSTQIPSPLMPAQESQAPVNNEILIDHSEQDTQLFIGIISSMQTMEAKFEQLSINNYRQTQQSSSGVFKVKKPGKFAWLIEKPYEQYILSNGKKVWDYDVDLEEVNISKVDAQNSQMMDLLQSDKEALLLSDYAISADRYASETVFTFVPKLENSEIAQIYISFVGNVLNSIRIQTDLEQATIFEFSDVQTNIEIKDSVFELAIPDGIDVYDETLF